MCYANLVMDDSFEPTLKPSFGEKLANFRESFGTILIVILAPTLAILISIFVFRVYQVDGPSMLTTLHDKDRLIIDKIPRTVARVTGNPYVPNRYDVIVFNHSGYYGSLSKTNKQVIKRVIALPGEKVQIKDGNVTVFNKQHPNGYQVDLDGPEANVIPVTTGDESIRTVGENEVFVLGDNRVNSSDSREMGNIKSEDIVGKLVLRIYPFTSIGVF